MAHKTKKKKPIQKTSIDFECNGVTHSCVCIASRRRSYAVLVRPDGTIEVRYPVRTPLFAVKVFVSSKRRWIENKIEEVKFAGVGTPLQGKHGDTLFVAGVEKYLEVCHHHTLLIEEHSGVVRVYTDSLDHAHVLSHVLQWYKAQALVLFQERLEEVAQGFGITHVPSLRIKNLKGRWGSLSPDNEMTLSLALAAAPVEALDQVIAHELVHLKHRHHKKSFYDELTKHYPKWKEHNKLLSPKYMLK